MKGNRKELENILSQYFLKIHFDKAAIKQYKQALLSQHGVLEGKSNGVLLGIIKLNTLTDEELFWFSDVALQLKPNLFNIEDYYSASGTEGMNDEISQYKSSKVKTDKNVFPIRFKNVLRVNEDQFVTTITAKQLADLYRKQVVVYNIWTQRNPTIKVINGIEVPTITMNKSSINAIAKLLEDGMFIPNTLTFNVREENFGKVKFNEERGVLTLDCPVDILDGAHRASAIIRTVETIPNFDLTFVLNIMTFSEKKAQRFIAQEDKRNKISKSYVATLDSARMENLVVSRLNEDEKFYFYGQIKTLNLSKDDTKVVFDSGKMIDLVGGIFHPTDNTQAIELEKFLCEQINALVDADKSLLTTLTDSDLRVLFIYFNKYYNAPEVLGDRQKTLKVLQEFRDNPNNMRNRNVIVSILDKMGV